MFVINEGNGTICVRCPFFSLEQRIKKTHS